MCHVCIGLSIGQARRIVKVAIDCVVHPPQSGRVAMSHDERRDLVRLLTITRTVLQKTVTVTLRAPFEAMMS